MKSMVATAHALDGLTPTWRMLYSPESWVYVIRPHQSNIVILLPLLCDDICGPVSPISFHVTQFSTLDQCFDMQGMNGWYSGRSGPYHNYVNILT